MEDNLRNFSVKNKVTNLQTRYNIKEQIVIKINKDHRSKYYNMLGEKIEVLLVKKTRTNKQRLAKQNEMKVKNM